MKSFKTAKGTELPLLDLRGKPYLQVAHRFVMLDETIASYSIQTEILVMTSDETVCRATVRLYDELQPELTLRVATATKRENTKGFADHLEKAETGAIGRALAMLGFGTQFAVQDMEEGDRLADAPVVPAKKNKVTDF